MYSKQGTGGKIEDEFTNLPVSRQRKGQLRNVKNGFCRFCKSIPVINQHLCKSHRERARQYKSKYYRIRKEAYETNN